MTGHDVMEAILRAQWQFDPMWWPEMVWDERQGRETVRLFSCLDLDGMFLVPNVVEVSADGLSCEVVTGRDDQDEPVLESKPGRFRKVRWARDEDYQILSLKPTA